MVNLDQIAKDIRAAGGTHMFGIPGGGTSLGLIDAFERSGGNFHLSHFEGAAVIMAAAAGRVSEGCGFSTSIKGPGLANAIPGLAAAWFESMPVVHLTEAYPCDAAESFAHKRLAAAALTNGIARKVGRFQEGGNALLEMVSAAKMETPSPVVAELIEGACETFDSPKSFSVDSEDLMRLVEKAVKPLLIVGSLALRESWAPILNVLQIPVFTTAAAKGAMDETLPHAAGVYTGVGGPLTPETQLLSDCDLVVCMGITAREVLKTQPFPVPAVTIEAVYTPGRDAFSFAAASGVDQAGAVFEPLQARAWGVDQLVDIKHTLRERMLEGFLPGCVFDLMERHFRGRARLVLDTGHFCTIGEHTWRTRFQNGCLLSGQGRYMGTGLPMALGASIADRQVPTLAVLGDGGIGMYVAEARLAVLQKLPLLIVLMSDNGFGSIRGRAVLEGLTQKPLLVNAQHWAPVFEAMGMPARRAHNSDEVSKALQSWTPESGPAFLEIQFEPDAYLEISNDIR